MPEPKLSSSVTLKDRALWSGEIELHEDKIVISGWAWTGPVEETVALSTVSRFYKWTTSADSKRPNFRLSVNGAPSISGQIKGAELWASELEDDERVEVKRRH